MNFLRNPRLYLITGFMLLVAAMYMAPEHEQADDSTAPAAPSVFSLEEYRKAAVQQLTAAEKKKVEVLENPTGQADSILSVHELVQLAGLWDSFGYPAVSGYYFETASKLQGRTADTVRAYLRSAADRFLWTFRSASDSSEKHFFLDRATGIYEKLLQQEPGNHDVMAGLGLCYAETTNPMRGIKLLKDVVSADPGHEMAQFNLGLLSVRSGQYVRAAERFEQVLKINSGNIDVYLYLGNVYSQLGDTGKAVQNIKKYQSKINDPAAVAAADEMIKQIRTSGIPGVKN